jgi:hypothetical protein
MVSSASSQRKLAGTVSPSFGGGAVTTANDPCRQPVELSKLKGLPGHRRRGTIPLVAILAGSGALLAVWLIATSGPSKSLRSLSTS